jgi:hypothetical protein
VLRRLSPACPAAAADVGELAPAEAGRLGEEALPEALLAAAGGPAAWLAAPGASAGAAAVAALVGLLLADCLRETIAPGDILPPASWVALLLLRAERPPLRSEPTDAASGLAEHGWYVSSSAEASKPLADHHAGCCCCCCCPCCCPCTAASTWLPAAAAAVVDLTGGRAVRLPALPPRPGSLWAFHVHTKAQHRQGQGMRQSSCSTGGVAFEHFRAVS